MSITKDAERQYVLSTDFLTVAFGDLTDETAVEAFDIPANAVIVGGEVVVDTAWDSGTSDVLDVGDGDDDDRYTSSQIDLTSTGRTALDLTGHKYTAADSIDLKWNGTGSVPTQGSLRVRIEYVVQDRGNENYR